MNRQAADARSQPDSPTLGRATGKIDVEATTDQAATLKARFAARRGERLNGPFCWLLGGQIWRHPVAQVAFPAAAASIAMHRADQALQSVYDAPPDADNLLTTERTNRRSCRHPPRTRAPISLIAKTRRLARSLAFEGLSPVAVERRIIIQSF